MSVAAPVRYRFKGKNVAVFSWYGCKLETYWTDAAGHAYVSDETPMVSYVNTHAQVCIVRFRLSWVSDVSVTNWCWGMCTQLEARRDVALSNSEAGPRVSKRCCRDDGNIA